ncbi:DUF924 family protein [Marinicella gelatinilytica]|uniref:DUF924 family protein n=1 Tax=Marinicella gelatinilytica TaxID=2996017 RepID=UPI002260C349|nr:DUF924 family protein [Marinicella gelatinilytica]MCX7544219.1 DUF924 domain-containing protein [Marinicella gelatinilytica]
MDKTNQQEAQQVLNFWYGVEPAMWFKKDKAFDDAIRTQFFSIWQQAAAGELSAWRSSIEGRLAEIIVLDQFSRNLLRNQGEAFAQDGMALILSQEALRHCDYLKLPQNQAKFLIMPFMHSESKAIQDQSVKLFEALGDASSLDYAKQHRDIIIRFGRYPHRNQVLGRVSTEEEKAFLKQPGSSF